MDYCTENCLQRNANFSYDQYCALSQQLCHQDTVQFIQGYYCILNQSFFLLVIMTIVLMVFLFKAMDRIAAQYLTPCVQTFIQKFKISSSLAGVTFLAFANGAPDVLTAIVAGNSDSDSTVLIPFGSIFGAVLFCGAFILATVIQLQPSSILRVKKVQILQPLIFYVAGIIFLMIVSIVYGKMNMYISGVLVLLYFVHIIFHVQKQRKEKKESLLSNEVPLSSDQQTLEKKQTVEQAEQPPNIVLGAIDDAQYLFFQYTITPIKAQNWHPVKALFSLTISPFVMAFTQDAAAIFEASLGGVPVIVFISIPAILFIIHTIYLIVTKKRPQNMSLYSLYAFVVSVAWLTLVCSILINLLQLIQLLTDVNSVFLGLTLLAWANSIGGFIFLIVDYLTITSFARKGNPQTAIAGIFSGQLFNFLMGFAVSLLIRSIPGQFQFVIFSFTGELYEILSDSIIMIVMMGGLVFLILVGLMVWRLNGVLGKRQSIIILLFYAGFILSSVAISIISDYFRNYDCDWQPTL